MRVLSTPKSNYFVILKSCRTQLTQKALSPSLCLQFGIEFESTFGGMDQESALKLFKEGAIFIFLDFPVGSEFGIDLQSWNTGEKFRGVKMIPPGMHYIYYRFFKMIIQNFFPTFLHFFVLS